VSLYKRKSSAVWWVGLSVEGRPRLRQSTGETSRTEALKRHAEIEVALRSQPAGLKGNTWGKAVEKWCDVEERSDSELLCLAKFGKLYPDRMLPDVTPESIDQALSFCKTAGTYTRYRTMLAAILNLSDVKLKLVSRKDKKKKPRNWITPEQWDKLLAELPAHMKPMAAFAIYTGLRQANVLGLTWSKVDLKRKLVWVEAEDTKGDEAISVPLSAEALACLEGQVGIDKTYCFTFRGKPVKEIKTAFHAACIRAGLGSYTDKGFYRGFTWHGFRHTWATWHMQNGTPIEVLQMLGAWSDLRMVLNYSHHSPGHLASFADNSTRKTNHD